MTTVVYVARRQSLDDHTAPRQSTVDDSTETRRYHSSMKSRLASFVSVAVALCAMFSVTTVTAFQLSVPSRSTRCAGPLHESFKVEHDTAAVVDSNGRTFEIGGVARIAVANLKAFQVPPKGQGSFNDQKEFVPGKKFLDLPVGLRGTVSKVYDVDEVSANHPVQVKFVPGTHTDEGYDPPVAFLMHFSPEEVEVV